MDIKIIPFVISIAWELSSPMISFCIKRAVRNDLNREIEKPEDRTTCEDLIEYSGDATQLMSGLFITLVSIGMVTYFEIPWEFWFILYAILMIATLCMFLLIITSDPYKWTSKKVLYWNQKTIYAVGLNVLMIMILGVIR